MYHLVYTESTEAYKLNYKVNGKEMRLKCDKISAYIDDRVSLKVVITNT